MSENRIKGYVVGADRNPSGKLICWKVKVVDKTSCYDGKKFSIASTHDGLTLAPGLDVSFAIGNRKGRNGTKYQVAVDVSLL